MKCAFQMSSILENACFVLVVTPGQDVVGDSERYDQQTHSIQAIIRLSQGNPDYPHVAGIQYHLLVTSLRETLCIPYPWRG